MDNPTLTIHWLFSAISLLIMGLRLTWRKVARQDFNLGDYVTMAAIVCCVTRAGLIHVVLTWGTSNIPAAVRASHTFTEEEIYQREVGSKLSIVNRFFYNSYLWLQKLVLLDVYRRLMADLRWEKVTIRAFLFVFFVTYIVVQVANVIECQPTRLYWQVVPDPGKCAAAQLQLIVLGVLNIVTDIMLIILPIPVIAYWKTPWKRKIKLYILFTLGFFIIAVTVIRLPINAINKNSQVNRSTWASTELVTAAIVVNAPTLYGLWNLRRLRRSDSASGQKYPMQGGSGSGAHDEFWHPDARGLTTHARAGTSSGADDDETFAMGPMSRSRRPPDGILQTKEITMSEEVRSRDAERASVHSSEKGILRG